MPLSRTLPGYDEHEMATILATDESVRHVWAGVLGSDRMCRYYGYLAHRMKRIGDLLAIGTISGSAGAVVAVLSHLPEWTSLLAMAIVGVASIAQLVGRYHEKAARSADVYRQMEGFSIEWEDLWNGVYEREDEALREDWRRLSERQAAVLERVPVELPLAEGLARRSEREADRYWTRRYAAA